MTYKKAFLISLSLLISSNIYAMQIVEQHNPVQKNALTVLMFKGALQAQSSLKKKSPILLHNDGDFQVLMEGSLTKIPSENIKGLKKSLTNEQFLSFVKEGGYFWLTQNDKDDLFLQASVRGEGGGYFTGMAAMWTTRAVGYGALGLAILTNPAVIAEAHLIHQTIEMTANGAFFIGCALPTA